MPCTTDAWSLRRADIDHLAHPLHYRPMTHRSVDDEVRALVHDVAIALLPDIEALGAQMAEHLGTVVSELNVAGAQPVVRATCQANTSMVLDSLVRGVPISLIAPSAEVLQLTRAMVQRGLSWLTVMRGYRLGTMFLIDRWADAVDTSAPGNPRAVAVAAVGTSYMLTWLDTVIERLADEFRDEEERLARERSLARVEDVKQVLLGGPDIRVDDASTRLGYRLSGRHVAAVLRDCADEPDPKALSQATRDLTHALGIGIGQGLIIRVDVRTVWCWIPASDVPLPRLPAPKVRVRIALGRPATGLEGFRQTHREALDALRVAETTERFVPGIVHYQDVDVAAMCLAEPDRCRDFIRTELGPLLEDDDSTRRHRATLVAYYAANSNFRAAASHLGVHHNTVRYRLEHVERVLGRRLDDRRLALELALHLHSVLTRNAQPTNEPG